MHAYYLDHMGIDRWLLRSPDPRRQSNPCILVIAPRLSHKASILFGNMLRSVALAPEDVDYTTWSLWEKQQQHELMTQRAVIVLDNALLTELKIQVPVFYLPALEKLLDSGYQKKQAYLELLKLRQFLSHA